MDGPNSARRTSAILDLDLVFGARRTSRSGRRRAGTGRPIGRGAAGRQHPPPARRSGRRATSPPSVTRTTTGRESGSLGRPVRAWDDDLDAPAAAAGPAPTAPAAPKPPRPIIPGERAFRDGDRVRHGRWGDGIVVTSKLTRSDEEVTVAFKDASVGRKTMLVSLRQPRDRRITEIAPDPDDLAGRLAGVVNLAEFEELARAAMDPAAFDYVAGGPGTNSASTTEPGRGGAGRSGRGSSLDVSAVDPRTTFIGGPSALPVAIAPMAFQSLAHADGEDRDGPGGGERGDPIHAVDDVVPFDRGRCRGRAGWHALVSALHPGRSRDHPIARRAGRCRRFRGDRPHGGPAGPRLPRPRSGGRASCCRPWATSRRCPPVTAAPRSAPRRDSRTGS